jgi:hypothetical protein
MLRELMLCGRSELTGISLHTLFDGRTVVNDEGGMNW